MVRTQIYLTEEENRAIAEISRESGEGKSEIIRQAIDEFMQRRNTSGRLMALRSGRGLWEGRADIPDVRKLRETFDRY